MCYKISELEMKNFPALQERLIPRSQITLKNTELGAGHFGKVYKGQYCCHRNSFKVKNCQLINRNFLLS